MRAADLPRLQPRFDQVQRIADDDACGARYVACPEVGGHVIYKGGGMAMKVDGQLRFDMAGLGERRLWG